MKFSYVKYIFALLLFGSNGIVASFINLSSYEIVFFRTLIGSLFLISISFIAGGRLTFYKHKKQFLYVVISGAAMGTSWIFLYEAYQQIGISVASLEYYCGPVIVMALSPIIFKEKLSFTKGLGFVIVVCGLFLINGYTIGEQKNLWGLFYGLMSALVYAVMVIFNKKASDIKGLENSMLQLLFSFITVAVFVCLKQGFVIKTNISSLPFILILGLCNTGIGCYLYFSSIGKLPIQTVAILGYIEPLSAVIFSVIFLKEVMTFTQAIGALLIIGGAVLGECIFNKSNYRCKRRL